jgi:hypothetical protein
VTIEFNTWAEPRHAVGASRASGRSARGYTEGLIGAVEAGAAWIDTNRIAAAGCALAVLIGVGGGLMMRPAYMDGQSRAGPRLVLGGAIGQAVRSALGEDSTPLDIGADQPAYPITPASTAPTPPLLDPTPVATSEVAANDASAPAADADSTDVTSAPADAPSPVDPTSPN